MTDEEMIHCDDPARQMERLKAIMHRLRSPGGCPWDAEQSHVSLIPNLIEEAYECVDAIRHGGQAEVKEEFGDLLLQVVFHSEMARENGHFDFDAVARGICDKMIRRHPHVFGESSAGDSDEVLRQWDEIKRGEKGEKDVPRLHGTGKGLPALVRGAKLLKKAAKTGFEWRTESDCMSKVREELGEVEAAMADGARTAEVEEELGDLMFAVLNVVRMRKLDPEVVMADANVKFERRFGRMEEDLKAMGKTLEQSSLQEMHRAWDDVKRKELQDGR